MVGLVHPVSRRHSVRRGKHFFEKPVIVENAAVNLIDGQECRL